jgi:hypothetical protein
MLITSLAAFDRNIKHEFEALSICTSELHDQGAFQKPVSGMEPVNIEPEGETRRGDPDESQRCGD